MMPDPVNINHFWSSLIIEECIRHSITHFCISPGSRSTPLTTAVARNPAATTTICYDERGAAFFALGYARATGKPAVLICTSGTALANYYPAVVEASMDYVPMFILSADRPPELYHTGANQTIIQQRIFGEYPRSFMELPCPDEKIPPEYVLTTIDQALYQCMALPQGVVHLNCQFREPLAPVPVPLSSGYPQRLHHWAEHGTAYTRYAIPGVCPTINDIHAIDDLLRKHPNAVLLVGSLKNDEERRLVLRLAEHYRLPVIADILSGLRHSNTSPLLIPYADQILLSPEAQRYFSPDLVLRFGGRITSKRVWSWLEQHPPALHCAVQPFPFRHDPTHGVTHTLVSALPLFCQGLLDVGEPMFQERSHTQVWSELSERINGLVEQHTQQTFGEIGITRMLVRSIPENQSLVLGNSMPIRDADMYGSEHVQGLKIAGNRGASGIDGLIATATGFAFGEKKTTTLLLGDVSALHDLSSLTLLRQCKDQLILIVVNNQGGGIFSFLPIAAYHDVAERYFGTPHHYSFEHIARQFDCDYYIPGTLHELQTSYQSAQQSGRRSLIEVRSIRAANVDEHKTLQTQIRETVTNFINRERHTSL